ncbi:MAG TPA: hypothetical protein VNA25_30690 [Phycisphaerae bacterium]|nr:hypothetical protein [Phycisphaerae bacterium]
MQDPINEVLIANAGATTALLHEIIKLQDQARHRMADAENLLASNNRHYDRAEARRRKLVALAKAVKAPYDELLLQEGKIREEKPTTVESRARADEIQRLSTALYHAMRVLDEDEKVDDAR